MLSRLTQFSRSSRPIFSIVNHLSTGKRTLKAPLRSKKPSSLRSAPGPAAIPVAVEDAWTEVVDKSSGQIYYWNTETNETTALGAPRPGSNSQLAQQQAAPQSGGMMRELGGVMAQGFAFGVGSSVAHSVVGSMFGGSSGGGGDSSAGGGDDSFDI